MAGIMETAGSIKKVIDIANELKNVELKEAILNLKEDILELKEENMDLKENLSEKQKYNMKFIDNYYWNIKENGEKEGPFCPACWDGDGKAVRMQEYEDFLPECPVCQMKIKTKNK